MNAYTAETKYGITWVRTWHTEQVLEMTSGDLAGMAAIATDVNATIEDNLGIKLAMQANGWTAIPEGMHATEAAYAIDTALEALLAD